MLQHGRPSKIGNTGFGRLRQRGSGKMQAAVRESIEILERARDRAKSRQPRLQNKRPDDINFFTSVMNWVNMSFDQEPEYKADSRNRDKWLSSFWKEEPHWAGVISQVNMIDANRGWTLTG